MSKLNFSILFILIFISILLIQINIIYKNSLPLIKLPEFSHNTVGEIPFVKEMDKNFAEIQKSYFGSIVVMSPGSGGFFIYDDSNY